MNRQALRIHPRDTVAVAVQPLHAGQEISIANRRIVLSRDIPQGHKFSLKRMATGEPVIKYGFPIGTASREIPLGTHVHTHNVRTRLTDEEIVRRYQPEPTSAYPEPAGERIIQAYERPDGSVGIRNELWIIPTVGCVNKTASSLASWASVRVEAGDFPGIDGVCAWEHPHGCSQLGDDHVRTQTILADLVCHPNAAGVLVVGLGCENNTIESFKRAIGPIDTGRVEFLIAQDHPDEIEEGKTLLVRLARYGGTFRRVSVGLSRLVVGLKCGGSDGLSGITANPLVGRFSDFLIALGGSAILTEIPEMFGAEDLLMNRCADRQVYDRLVGMMNGFKRYFTERDQAVHENPSPGNKDGGITTLEEKSLGCVQKGGGSVVVDVLPYGARVSRKGLNILGSPGNDIVSTTALSAAGAHMILFTTGRGTPLGSAVPTVKISSNTDLARKKAGWIDVDAGKLLHAEPPEVFNELVEFVIDVASGRTLTKNETNGYREIAIVKDGVTL